MRRWFTRISPRRAAFGGLLCLFLGVVTTVGVAWGIVMFVVDTSPPVSMRFNDLVWVIDLGKREPELHLRWSNGANRGLGFHIGRMQVTYSFGEQLSPKEVGRMDEVEFVEVGWPLFAMQGMRSHGPDSLGWSHPRINAPNGRDLVAPLRPLWPGFLIDTFFYGALWFGLFLGPGAAQRTIRRKRGRCVKCGYDLRGDLDTGCPECGWNRNESRLAHPAGHGAKERAP